MYSNQLLDRIISLLAPDGFTERTESEARYSARQLAEGAVVTRSAPSPTGFLHIGTIYMSPINKLVGLSTSGVYMLRIEDTDKKREIENGVRTIVSMLERFNLKPDEGVDQDSHSYGAYGPYMQSERGKMYLGYAVDLLRKGRAYPCFATPEELKAITDAQQAAKVRPGYYGDWAKDLWRDRGEEQIVRALDEGMPFVLRFRSEGLHEKRVAFDDVLKGHMELPENDLDVPLIKSDEYRLPTYHLAHVVDDYLMQTNMILRGDEWLPSTPLHFELCDALAIPRFRYAHFAPINIMDGNSKRKLSKRKDPQADVAYFLAAGYPTEAVLEYLVRLANSNFEDWRKENPATPLWDFPFSFEKWAKARGALLDMQKLNDVSKDVIGAMTQADFTAALLGWATEYAPYFKEAAESDMAYAEKVFTIERDGEKPRKDLAKWEDAPEQYGYFFDGLFSEHFAPRIGEELKDVDPALIVRVCETFLRSYNPADNQETWLAAFRQNAESVDMKLGDFARIIRVKLTGKNRSPDLWAVLQTMGEERVRSRLS